MNKEVLITPNEIKKAIDNLLDENEKLQKENEMLHHYKTLYQNLKDRKDKATNNLIKSIESINKKLENNKEPFEVIDGKIIYLNDYQVCRLKAIRMKSKEILQILEGVKDDC